jgi:hypothetical protein
MPLTRVQIISQSLTLLGKAPIMTLNNQSDIANAANYSFDMLLSATLSECFWRFATTIVQLQQVLPAPIGGYWFYAYQLPANYLKLVHLWPQNYDFEMYENNLMYSNYNDQYTPLYLEYVFQPLVQNLPPYFVKYFIYELAAYLALANAQRPDYYQVLLERKGIELAIAQAADCQNRPQTWLQSQPILTRRYVSTYASG